MPVTMDFKTDNIVNVTDVKRVERSELIWLGNGTYQTPENFLPHTLLVFREGQQISTQGINGISILAPNQFAFKLASTITERTMVVAFYVIQQ